MRQGMMFAIQIEVRSKLGALRVIVGDARSGALGSLNIPLKDVPPAPNTAPPPPPAAEKP